MTGAQLEADDIRSDEARLAAIWRGEVLPVRADPRHETRQAIDAWLKCCAKGK